MSIFRFDSSAAVRAFKDMRLVAELPVRGDANATKFVSWFALR